jgi:hypothetical protein
MILALEVSIHQRTSVRILEGPLKLFPGSVSRNPIPFQKHRITSLTPTLRGILKQRIILLRRVPKASFVWGFVKGTRYYDDASGPALRHSFGIPDVSVSIPNGWSPGMSRSDRRSRGW